MNVNRYLLVCALICPVVAWWSLAVLPYDTVFSWLVWANRTVFAAFGLTAAWMLWRRHNHR